MRVSAALYPFTSEFLQLVRHFDALQDKYALSELVSPPGFGLTGKDAGYSRNHHDVGIAVSSGFNFEGSSWRTLLITRPVDVDVEGFDDDSAIAARAALEAGKQVSYYCARATGAPAPVLELQSEYPLHMSVIDGHTKQVYSSTGRGGHRTIDVPVVLVGGLLADADTSEILLSLATRFRTERMNPLVLTRYPIASMFGFHCYSSIFEDNALTEEAKIMELITFAKNLELLHMPGIILAEAPDAVMKYSASVPNGFGVRSYMLCQAMPPDYFVCGVPYNDGHGKLIEMVSERFSHSLGVPISAAHVSNLLLDTMELSRQGKVSYTFLDPSLVRERVRRVKRESGIPVFDIVNDGVDELYLSLGGIRHTA